MAQAIRNLDRMTPDAHTTTVGVPTAMSDRPDGRERPIDRCSGRLGLLRQAKVEVGKEVEAGERKGRAGVNDKKKVEFSTDGCFR